MARGPIVVLLQPGASASATLSLLSGTLPVLVTRIVQVAVPPYTTGWGDGVLVMVMAGASVTVTSAVAWAVTVVPSGPVPLAMAVLVKPAVTSASEQV